VQQVVERSICSGYAAQCPVDGTKHQWLNGELHQGDGRDVIMSWPSMRLARAGIDTTVIPCRTSKRSGHMQREGQCSRAQGLASFLLRTKRSTSTTKCKPLRLVPETNTDRQAARSVLAIQELKRGFGDGLKL